MSNYEYTPFEDNSGELLENDPEVISKNAHNGIIELFIMHNYIQVRHALDGDYFDSRYADLSKAVNEAEEAFKSKNTAWQSMAMMRLGIAVGQMNRPTELEVMKHELKMSKLEMSRRSQSYTIDRRNTVYETLEEIAQKWASHYWHMDKDQTIRTTRMADEYIYPIIAESIKVAGVHDDYLPTPNTIKEWIKPVAPEYAQRRGRPKKKK